MARQFTADELELAKTVDLCKVAEAFGYGVKRIGGYHTIAQMDSIRIYDRKSWYRWSDGSGGSQIDFLQTFAGMDVTDAVEWLLKFSGQTEHIVGSDDVNPADRHREFSLPPAASNNLRVIRYLTKDRAISPNTVNHFIDLGLVYESEPYHNVVFIGKDPSGVARFATMRGTHDGKRSGDNMTPIGVSGKVFKCDVRGSDKRYGFHLEGSTNQVRVFEGAIDLMSFYDMAYDGSHLLALGSTADVALEQYLSDHSFLNRIVLSLDNDEPGRKAQAALLEKYRVRGYEVSVDNPPEEYKDFNDWLREMRRNPVVREPSYTMLQGKR